MAIQDEVQRLRALRGYQPPKRGQDTVPASKPTIWWAWKRLRSNGEPIRLTDHATPRRPVEREALDHLS